jgi:hypothetical protein
MDVVSMVSVVEAGESPGVRVAGEKVATHPRGNPEQLNEMDESKGPFLGVAWIIQLTGRPAAVLKAEGDPLSAKSDTRKTFSLEIPPAGGGFTTDTPYHPGGPTSKAERETRSSVSLT